MRKPDHFLNSIVGSLKKYTPGEQPKTDGWIKLNTNEFPYPPSPFIGKELKKLSQNFAILRQYPDSLGEPLRSKLATEMNLRPDNILVTNGSDEALVLVSRVLLEKGDQASLTKITYSLYETILSSIGVDIVRIPMLSKTEHPFGVDMEALENSPAKAVFLANPNAITGEYLKVQELKKIIPFSEKIWILDEAYINFCDHDQPSFIQHLENEQNLIITQTLSKSHGLAGLRVGYLVCKNQQIMDKLYAIKDSYNQDRIAITLASKAIEDSTYYTGKQNEIKKQRNFLMEQLNSYSFQVIPSQANYILVKPPANISGEDLYLRLKQEKILVRHFKDPAYADHIRISIGSPPENQKLLEKLSSILRT